MSFILLAQTSINGEYWSNLTYVLIGFFVFLAAILGIIQLRKRLAYSPESLRDELTHFVKESGVGDEKVIFDYVDDYFSRKLLGFDEVIRFLISSLTILGLLGTFIGLAVLIVPRFHDLSSALNTTDFGTEFQTTLNGITGGFRTAFGTSIIGIISALLCSIVYHFYRHHIRYLKSNFTSIYLPSIVKATKKDNVAYDPVALYKEIQTYFIDGLNQFKEETVKSHNKLQAWGEGIITSHTSMVKEYVEANNTRIEAVSIELGKEYKALQTIAKDNLKVSSILNSVVSKLDSFADVIRNYGSTYENLIDKIDNFSQNFGNLFSNISTVVDQINQPSQLLSNLYTSIQEMVNNQNLIVNSNKDFMDKTHERFENLLTKNGESNQVVIAELKEYLEKFIETVRETFSQQSMDELLSNHTIKLLDSITVLKASLDEINISSVTPEQINQINDLMSSLSISVNSISKVIGNLNEMTGRIDKINRNLGKVFESLGG